MRERVAAFNQQPHCINHRIIKTENNVMVPSNSISLRTKFKKKMS